MTKATRYTAAALFALTVGYGAYETRHIDGDTGRPRNVQETPEPAPPAPRVWSPKPIPSPTPPKPTITIFEDGSARDSNGRTYPAGTYEWNCATMGNRICG